MVVDKGFAVQNGNQYENAVNRAIIWFHYCERLFSTLQEMWRTALHLIRQFRAEFGRHQKVRESAFCVLDWRLMLFLVRAALPAPSIGDRWMSRLSKIFGWKINIGCSSQSAPLPATSSAE